MSYRCFQMAREKLIDNIDGELRLDVATPRQVVYILVEVRKFLEQQKLQRHFPALTFFCNWAVHSKGVGLGAERILKRFDKVHGLVGPDGDVSRLSPQLQQAIGQTVNLSKFKDDLRNFLTSINLSTSLIDEPRRWTAFLANYSDVIQDCPLISNKSKVIPQETINIELAHLKTITIKRENQIEGAQVAANQQVVFGTRWILTAKNGDTGEFTMQFTVPKTNTDTAPELLPQSS
jgi:hypothetical protein